MEENPVFTPEIELESVSFYYPESEQLVFNGLSLELPKGVTTLVGQNGTGKSTLLLLAAGILLPVEGRVQLQGRDTRELQDERARQRHVSFVYQNMEFETEENIGDLLEFVHENGFHERKDSGLIPALVKVCELEKVLNKKTQEVSKGELQRAVIAFSLLYGSRIIMMDEPIFALEQYQKQRIMEFLIQHVHEQGLSLYYSLHELDLSQRYSDYLLLFQKSGQPALGLTRELFTRETIEKAYEVPLVMLKHREAVFRESLLTLTRRIRGRGQDTAQRGS
jgi:ABC-type cobalamin/Fe3+-siderophores transport system ATPase subunit